MKIGLIGNMNNNNFAMMRYLRDLGADAHLLLYANDGMGTLAHFSPDADTWNLARWAPYIHRTDIANAMIAALDFPYSWIVGARAQMRSWFGLRDRGDVPVSRRRIRQVYAGYDRLVGSGITPATLTRAGQSLHVFYPYSICVEFLESPEFLARFRGAGAMQQRLARVIARRQSEGIRAARHVLNYEPGATEATLLKHGVRPRRLSIPMVYNGEVPPDEAPSATLAAVFERIRAAGLSLLHHARVAWQNRGRYTDEEWPIENKNTQRLVVGLSELLAARPASRPLLLMVEYGPDVDALKELIAELGVQDHVVWLPKMQRRELMWLLSRVDVGCGEFYDLERMIWGGTGWETLACGKPLLQGFNFAVGEFERIYGYPPPPMLQVRVQADIARHLVELVDDPEAGRRIGQGARGWFDRHNGAGLARQWLDLLRQP